MQHVPRAQAFTPSLVEDATLQEHWSPAVRQLTVTHRHVDAGAGQSSDAQQTLDGSAFVEHRTEFGLVGAPSVIAGIVHSHEGGE